MLRQIKWQIRVTRHVLIMIIGVLYNNRDDNKKIIEEIS